MGEIALAQAWAKTDPVSQQPVVGVLTHSLNVGAVADAIVRRLCPAVSSLFSASTWRGLVCLAALHDIGKISPGFLGKCGAWATQHRPDDPLTIRDWVSREKNHARVSHIVLGKWFGGSAKAGYAVAVGGHHGRFTCGNHWLPETSAVSGAPSRELDDPDFQAARQDLLTRLQAEEIFGPLPQEPLSGKRKDETLVVFLTGFMTLADWVGSDEKFFGLEDPTPDEEKATLARASGRAERALSLVRWGETVPVPQRAFRELFGFEANPLQTALAEEVRGTPGLFIVEAPMGCGKTEAALHAAYLRWTEGGERGLYFALPTQLTSDRIYERANQFLRRAVASPDVSTLVHGSAWLREERAVEIHPASRTGDDPAHAVDARHWFASGRRSLLAPFGAGTLDQALLSVLPAKHCGLRLFALAGKVVVCDEVHSYDPYTSRLLDALIAELLRLRCTVIVLTATLPAGRKVELLRAAGVTELPAVAGYPLITAVPTGSTRAVAREVASDPNMGREIRLEHFSEADPLVWDRACEAAKAGACVLIIRNTVARAQATFRDIRGERNEGGPEVALLHSRFPRWRRDALEGVWLRRLGKPDGQTDGEARPKGCVLVATQVVEQSVDIDADLLITDLAPTDPLFQRMGRLHRHPKNVRPAGYKVAQTWILHPALEETLGAKEIKERLGASGKVYPPATMFRSWEIWRDRASVVLPGAIRELLDATYAPLAETAAAGLRVLSKELEAQVTKRIDTAAARMDRLNAGSKEDRDDGTLTRWNEQPTMNLLLLQSAPRKEPNGEWEVELLDGMAVRVNPYQWSLSVAQALHRNVVSVPWYAVGEWMKLTPPWLGEYFEDGVAVGVVEGEKVEPLAEVSDPSCRVCWSTDEGVGLQSLKSAKKQPNRNERDEEDWRDFEDDGR